MNVSPAEQRRLPLRERPSLVWLVAFAAFLLMGGAWALAMPYDGPPDEIQHVIRAAGVAKGQILQKPAAAKTGTGTFQRVGEGIARDNIEYYCYHNKPWRTPDCAPEPGPSHKDVTAASGTGRYNPLYYAIVGGPVALWPNWTGVILSRLISAALCAAFLASALVSCVQWRRFPLLLGGLVIAVTPFVINLSGAVNPSSVEVAASVSLFAALIPLLLSEERVAVVAWLRRAALAAAIILQLRTMGPVIVAGALIVLLAPPVRTRLRQLWERRDTRWWASLVAVSAVVGVAWTKVAHATDISHYRETRSTWEALTWELTSRLPWYLDGMADQLSYTDTNLPRYIPMAWTMAFGLVFLSALAWGSKVSRWRLAALTAGMMAIPVITELYTYNSHSFAFQARYLLPLAVGIPLLATFILGQEKRIDLKSQIQLIRVGIVLLVPLQFITLIHVMIRFQHGLGFGRPVNPFTGVWLPPAGTVLPVMAMIVGVSVFGALLWHSAAIHPEAVGKDGSPELASPHVS